MNVDAIYNALCTVVDPELGVNVVDLGLVYQVNLSIEGQVEILMTLTTPFCPMQEYFQTAVEQALLTVAGYVSHELEFTFSPPWSVKLLTENGRQQLALRGIPILW